MPTLKNFSKLNDSFLPQDIQGITHNNVSALSHSFRQICYKH